MGEVLPDLMTLKDVLLRLHGTIKEKTLRKHLSETPIYGGGPTHRRWGRKFVFRNDDFKRLLDSLECRSKSSPVKIVNISMSVEPSAEKAFLRAQELLTRNRRKRTELKESMNSGQRVSLARAR